MYFKVDYSVEAKRNFRINMAGQFAIYHKKHWWNKWREIRTYADKNFAYIDMKSITLKKQTR